MTRRSALTGAFPALLALAGATGPVAGQGSISTGRPSFATGPGVVTRVQLEAGYQVTEGVAADDHAIGQVLLRLPLIAAAELRLGLGSLVVTGPSGSRETGLEDLTVGTKIRLRSAEDTRGLGPAVSVILAASLPTGSDAIGADGIQPGGNLVLGWTAGPRLELLSNTILTSRDAGGGRSTELAQDLYLGIDIPGPAGIYGEVYTSVAEAHVASTAAGAGLTWAVSRDLQLDLHGGVGLSAAAPAYYFGFGFGRRW